MENSETLAFAPSLSISDAAAKRVQELLEQEGNYNLKLRVYIQGGGCSGFQYGFAFDENLRPDDHVIEKALPLNTNGNANGNTNGNPNGIANGNTNENATKTDLSAKENKIVINLVVDALSLMYLNGAEVDYVEKLQGAHFTVKNPNAQTTCSCGSSFAL
ncbi:MAG: iron-sulfur cluster assembly accessory protein [Candidatus Berkiellales bacterium]